MSWKEVSSLLSDDDTLEAVYLTVDADEDTVIVDPPTRSLVPPVTPPHFARAARYLLLFCCLRTQPRTLWRTSH